MKLKKFVLLLFSFAMVFSLLFPGIAYAQEEELQLPDPGITPDSPFYFLDNLGKNMGLFLAFGPEAKAQKAVEYAGERLAEAQAMAAKGKANGVEQAANGYDKFVAMAAEKAEEARQKGASDNISGIVASATTKHLSALDEVAERFPDAVPEQARQAIARAREASMQGTESALKGLAQENPERAAEIAMNAVEARLNRANTKAEENNAEEVEEAINEAERLFDFGTEISEIAKGLGEDTSTVDQLIAKATSIHLEVLAEVYEKVPEQAKQRIEEAMAWSIEGRQRAVEALETIGALRLSFLLWLNIHPHVCSVVTI